jgi:hypothetical protein
LSIDTASQPGRCGSSATTERISNLAKHGNLDINYMYVVFFWFEAL